MRTSTAILAGACLALFAQAGAHAQSSRPLRLIAGAAPGGGTDFVARVISPDLSARTGASVVIDNRGGAAGTVAGELAARANPDGNTYLIVSGNFSTWPSLYKRLSFNPTTDLVPVSNTSATPLVVVVNPSLPVKSVKELIAYAGSRSDPMNYASPGAGAMNHLATELFKRTAKVDMVHIAYKGGGPAVTALLGGEVQIYFSTLPAALTQSRAGRLRAIAVTGAKRSAVLPDLPTLAESGLPGYEVTVWFGLLAPKATPDAIVTGMQRHIVEVMRGETVRQRLASEGVEPIASTPAEFRAQINREVKQWEAVIRSANIQAD